MNSDALNRETAMQHVEGKPVSASTYVNHGCRCDACVDAARAHRASLRGKVPRKHGVRGYKLYECRCRVCVSAMRAEWRRYGRTSRGKFWQHRARDRRRLDARFESFRLWDAA